MKENNNEGPLSTEDLKEMDLLTEEEIRELENDDCASLDNIDDYDLTDNDLNDLFGF